MINILVVEDDAELRRVMCRQLVASGFAATGCANPYEAYDALYEKTIDLVVSDIMMPRADGFELAENIRRQDANMPILFVTARDDLGSKRRGFSLGIDDYMVKPVDLDELVLRVNALLRRARIQATKKIEVGGLVLDEGEVSATVDGRDVPLTLREFQILFKLLSYPRQAFTRSQLLDEFSGIDADTSLRSVDVHITNLRAKFADCPYFQIKTVRGLGYKAVVL